MTAVAAPAREAGCDLARAWTLGPQVALRPEPFGALVYDFDSRRLSFLKSPVLLEVVRSLDACASAREACFAAGVPDAELPAYCAQWRLAVARGADSAVTRREFAWRIAAQSGAMENRLLVAQRFEQECR